MMTEVEYRKLIQGTFGVIEAAFENVDPDIAECDVSQGAMTIRLADGSKCILSAQPSVRQLWMAVAAKGTAYHFNYESSSGKWMDDKGRSIEALSFLRTYLREATGVDLAIGG